MLLKRTSQGIAMPTPISIQAHKDSYYTNAQSFSFAKDQPIVALSIEEIKNTLFSFPMAFIKNKGGSFTLCALMGLPGGKNLYIASNGKYLAGYKPALLRTYPFSLAYTDSQALTLCVDEDSGLLQEHPGDDAQPFFDEQAEPAPQVKQTLTFLEKIHKGITANTQIANQLNEHNLIENWHIKISSPQGEQTTNNLYRINEKALNNLKPEELKTLQQSTALNIATIQLLSMSHINNFSSLLQAHHNADEKLAAANGEIDVEKLFRDNDMINFNF